jgi:hypothetical protein
MASAYDVAGDTYHTPGHENHRGEAPGQCEAERRFDALVAAYADQMRLDDMGDSGASKKVKDALKGKMAQVSRAERWGDVPQDGGRNMHRPRGDYSEVVATHDPVPGLTQFMHSAACTENSPPETTSHSKEVHVQRIVDAVCRQLEGPGS